MSSENLSTRDRILRSAIALLETSDPKQTRMSDIARKAGISRQAVYLHFPNRTELLIAAVQYLDQIKGVEARLAASRAADSGAERLALWVEAWGNYIPEIHGVARALIALQDADEDARAAWADRMAAVQHGCRAAVDALHGDGSLRPDLDRDAATALLHAMLSVQSWEILRLTNGMTQEQYIDLMQKSCARALTQT